MAKQTVAIGIGGGTAAKKKVNKKPTTKKVAKAKAKAGGVIDAIVSYLTAASAKAPITKQQLLDRLAAKFKDRERDAMKTTISCQLGARLETARKLKVHRNDDGGYWATAK